mmetsp:Transcript_61165/g.157750  ORF Transcript_61165/g.157750 Transcript_61165/m.157750 type:complete len:92 (-) Transcript_61165:139-414(-)
MALAPRTALLVGEAAGREREGDARLLLAGDLVKVLPGAKIPADGLVESGGHQPEERGGWRAAVRQGGEGEHGGCHGAVIPRTAAASLSTLG